MKQDPLQNVLEVAVPPLGSGGAPIEFITWLVASESEVIPGERIAELLTHGILFHLEAPAAGRLTDLRVASGANVQEGEVVARIFSSPEEEDEGAR